MQHNSDFEQQKWKHFFCRGAVGGDTVTPLPAPIPRRLIM